MSSSCALIVDIFCNEIKCSSKPLNVVPHNGYINLYASLTHYDVTVLYYFLSMVREHFFINFKFEIY